MRLSELKKLELRREDYHKFTVDRICCVAYTVNAGSNTLYTHVSELTFKRSFWTPGMREPPKGGSLHIQEVFYMDIYVYSDESGVFDKSHNDYFVFGGVLFFSKEERDVCTRKYKNAEKTIRKNGHYKKDIELKAATIRNKEKGKLFRALSQYQRFGIVIRQKRILSRIFASKKDKQRYLDFAYKIGLKRLFNQLMRDGRIAADQVENIHVFVDQHTTATNGRYELREGLEQELKLGTYNYNYSTFFPPIFPNLRSVTLSFCNSEKQTLIRSADIVANRIYHICTSDPNNLHNQNTFIVELP